MKKIIKHPNGRVQVQSVKEIGAVTKVQQHHKDAHDINQIMKKYQKVGVSYNALPPSQKGVYGDFTAVKTYQQAMQSLVDAQNSFMTLPSSVRKRFGNDPNELFEFLNDKKNREEAIKLGLLEAPPSTEPTAVTPASSPTPPTPSTT